MLLHNLELTDKESDLVNFYEAVHLPHLPILGWRSVSRIMAQDQLVSKMDVDRSSGRVCQGGNEEQCQSK